MKRPTGVPQDKMLEQLLKDYSKLHREHLAQLAFVGELQEYINYLEQQLNHHQGGQA